MSFGLSQGYANLTELNCYFRARLALVALAFQCMISCNAWKEYISPQKYPVSSRMRFCSLSVPFEAILRDRQMCFFLFLASFVVSSRSKVVLVGAQLRIECNAHSPLADSPSLGPIVPVLSAVWVANIFNFQCFKNGACWWKAILCTNRGQKKPYAQNSGISRT